MNLTKKSQKEKPNHYLIILCVNACLVLTKISYLTLSQIPGISWQKLADDRGLVWNCAASVP